MSDSTQNRRVFGDSLYRLFYAYQRALRDARRRGGPDLTVAQIRVLKNAYFLAEATVHHIAEITDIDRAQITRIVAGLRERELITSHTNPRDRRSPIIECTAPGRALIEPIMGIYREAGACMAAGLSDAEVDRFVAVADTMADNLNAALDARRHD